MPKHTWPTCPPIIRQAWSVTCSDTSLPQTQHSKPLPIEKRPNQDRNIAVDKMKPMADLLVSAHRRSITDIFTVSITSVIWDCLKECVLHW